jgi:protein gp37
MPDGTIAGCYAALIAEKGVAKKAYPHGFEHHYFRREQVTQLAAGDEPKLIFPDSMSDMFAPNVPADHVQQILSAMSQAPHHAYQSLTKAAPQLLRYLGAIPRNLWVGVSSPPDFFKGCELSQIQQRAMLRRSLHVLAEVKEKTGNLVWLSAEPISWDLTSVIGTSHPLDWIVIGAASSGRMYYQPDPDHVRSLLKVMDATGTPVFFKGNIRELFDQDLGTPALNRWREDFPFFYRDGSVIPAVARRQEMCRQHGWTLAVPSATRRVSRAK